jgi:DNA-binding protein HU-beta
MATGLTKTALTRHLAEKLELTKARMGRNPQTGAAIKIKAKTVVKFRVAKSAKDVIAPPKK